jgi:hypothetical protein
MTTVVLRLAFVYFCLIRISSKKHVLQIFHFGGFQAIELKVYNLAQGLGPLRLPSSRISIHDLLRRAQFINHRKVQATPALASTVHLLPEARDLLPHMSVASLGAFVGAV